MKQRCSGCNVEIEVPIVLPSVICDECAPPLTAEEIAEAAKHAKAFEPAAILAICCPVCGAETTHYNTLPDVVWGCEKCNEALYQFSSARWFIASTFFERAMAEMIGMPIDQVRANPGLAHERLSELKEQFPLLHDAEHMLKKAAGEAIESVRKPKD